MEMASRMKVIIDTDAGIDDALAIFMVIAQHKKQLLDLIAITTLQGNAKLNDVNRNVLRVLDTVDLLTKIPVYSGADNALVHKFENTTCYHGQDGFGDANLSKPHPPVSLLQKEHAVFALVDLVNKYKGEVVLLAIGPLTNLALAIKIDPQFTTKLAGLYIMGGNVTGEGNDSVSSEFNFQADPDAARVVLEETKCLVKLVPWETCRYNVKISMKDRHNFTNEINTPIMDLMNLIEHRNLNKGVFPHWITCDQLSAAWMIHDIITNNLHTKAEAVKDDGDDGSSEAFIKSTTTYFCTVEVMGTYTRGQMVLDRRNRLNRTPNVTYMNYVDMERYKKYLAAGYGATD